MTSDEKNEIRHLRNGGWYWISRAVLNRYGRKLKASGIAVYNVLSSYANSDTQACFPTQKSIAGHLGLSVRTVNRKIRLLKEIKLIKVKKIRGCCLYSLLKVDMPNRIQLYDKRDTRDRTPGKTNNNKLIKINNKNKDVNEKIYNFKPISRFLKKYGQRNSKNHRN